MSLQRAVARPVIVVEVALVALVVLLDLGIPSLVILGLAGVSLLLHREGWTALGFHRADRPGRLAGAMFLLAAAWTLLEVGLIKPLETHVTGQVQDTSQFASLEGNLGQLVVWLVVSWVVAALGETVAFIGFVQTRSAQLLGDRGVRLGAAVALTSVLFGLLHTEYGVVGVTASTINAALYCVLRYRCGTLWAPVLAHGFINTIGLAGFYLVGPVDGLW